MGGDAFLDLLPPEDHADLMAAGRTRTVIAGQTVFLMDDDPTSFAVVLSGRVKLLARTDEGRNILIGLRTGGDILGEMGALDGRPRSVDVIAVDAVRLLVGSATLLQDFLRDHPSAWRAICLSLNSRLREADRDRAELVVLPGNGRVASRLADLAERYGLPQPDGTIEVPITQDELADWTGLSRPTVARALAAFRADGHVRTERRRITVGSPRALKHAYT